MRLQLASFGLKILCRNFGVDFASKLEAKNIWTFDKFDSAEVAVSHAINPSLEYNWFGLAAERQEE